MWRYFGTLPQFQSRDESRPHCIEGWNPSQGSVDGGYLHDRIGPDIAVIDPNVPGEMLHARVYAMGSYPKSKVVAVAKGPNHSKFYFVSADAGEPGAFEAVDIRYEGYWRPYFDPDYEPPYPLMKRDSWLPWPVPAMDWQERDRFLERLKTIESRAHEILYRGLSMCRICGMKNGFKGLCVGEWEWPEGFRHYIEAHGVRPTKDFEEFILLRTLPLQKT